MKIFFLTCLLIFSKVIAQSVTNYVDKVTEISLAEKLSHERVINADNVTSASENFDVKYYRCEWEMDPAVRFIKGKVTVYFTITSSANSISFDLMSPLITDSVKLLADYQK